jgi:ABC-type sugar transport system substrate-binding protein
MGTALALCALGLPACGDDDSGGGAGGSTGLDGKTVALVTYGDENPWGGFFNKAFKAKLEGTGVKVVNYATMDPGTQVQNLNQAIGTKPDLIVVSPVDTASMAVPMKKAVQAGLPVVGLGGVDPSVKADVMQINDDNELLGRFAAQNIVDGLKAQGKTEGKVIVIKGTAAMQVTQDRMKGFEAEMAKTPEYEVIEVQDGNWDPTLSGKIATQLFAKYGKDGIQAAFGMADYMAVPIIAAAKQAGIPVGGKDGLVVTGSNCFKAGIEAIKAGEMYGTATEDPGVAADVTADYVKKYLSGTKPPKVVVLPEGRVTKETLDKYEEQCSFA